MRTFEGPFCANLLEVLGRKEANMLAGSSTQHQDAKTDKGWELYVGGEAEHHAIHTSKAGGNPCGTINMLVRPFRYKGP